MCSNSGRHSIFCILPPHLLRAIAEGGTPEQRLSATRTLALDTTMRALRLSSLMRETRSRRAEQTAPAAKNRTILQREHLQQLPGTVVASEASPPTPRADVAVLEAFDGLGATWDFYFEVFDRVSIDDEGMPLDATVHYGDRYDNAFWDGSRMVFGDGDGQLFNRFTIALDVIGHELTHGVTEDESGLAYMLARPRRGRCGAGSGRPALL